ncbi:MAG: hypothetical protein CL556_05895 [Alphaproteobacteria bacterium]|nr:hypothetical protein [Alphaproteobacteria bacterium]
MQADNRTEDTGMSDREEDAQDRWNAAMNAAVAAKSGEVFNDVVFNFGVEIINFPEFPQADFEVLLGLIQDHRLHGMNGSWNLIAVFNYEFDRLNTEQEEQLLKVLHRVHASFSDWHTPFYIAEMIGQRYPDGRGLDAFQRMAKTRNQISRAFIPNGLEILARTAKDPLIKNRAMDQILSMRGDVSDQVKKEVDMAIERLVDRGAMGRA